MFPTPLLFGAPAPMFPLELCGEVNHEEAKCHGAILWGESCMMILTSTVFD